MSASWWECEFVSLYYVYGMTHLTAVRMCVPSLSPFPQLDSYADLCFSVWEVNSRVPVLGLKITLGLKFLIPPPPPPPLFSSFLTGTLLTSPFACFSFPRCLLFWNRLCSLRLSFFFPLSIGFFVCPCCKRTHLNIRRKFWRKKHDGYRARTWIRVTTGQTHYQTQDTQAWVNDKTNRVKENAIYDDDNQSGKNTQKNCKVRAKNETWLGGWTAFSSKHHTVLPSSLICSC